MSPAEQAVISATMRIERHVKRVHKLQDRLHDEMMRLDAAHKTRDAYQAVVDQERGAR